MRWSAAVRCATVVVGFMGSAIGCASVRFVQSDPSFRSARSAQSPEVFVEGTPARAYHVVGTIEIRGATNDQEILEQARAKGREVGCELLVARALVESSSVTSPPVLLAHGGLDAPKTGGPKRRVHDKQFLCGIYKPRQERDAPRGVALRM